MNYKLKNFIHNTLFKSDFGRNIYSFAASYMRWKRKNMSDEEYVINAFKENNGLELNLKNPVTFNEKLLWLSLNDHDPLKTQCADKYLVREYVTECGFPEILNELYGVYDRPQDIDFGKMPEKFFVKTNHDSGTYALIDKRYPESNKKALKKIEKSIRRNYYFESREWQYKNICPKILCEKYIETKDNFGLVDYRFFCFNGEIGFVAVDIGTTDPTGKHAYFAKRNLYDADFNKLDAKLKRESFDASLITKPQNYEKMKEIACVLSKPFKHVRVDFYNIDGNIIFGELTFCNGGGMQLLEPYSFNCEMGKRIQCK